MQTANNCGDDATLAIPASWKLRGSPRKYRISIPSFIQYLRNTRRDTCPFSSRKSRWRIRRLKRFRGRKKYLGLKGNKNYSRVSCPVNVRGCGGSRRDKERAEDWGKFVRDGLQTTSRRLPPWMRKSTVKEKKGWGGYPGAERNLDGLVHARRCTKPGGDEEGP